MNVEEGIVFGCLGETEKGAYSWKLLHSKPIEPAF